MYNSQYYTCEQIDQRLLQGYLDDYNDKHGTSLTKDQYLTLLAQVINKDFIVSQRGQSSNLVMSQKSVTCELDDINLQLGYSEVKTEDLSNDIVRNRAIDSEGVVNTGSRNLLKVPVLKNADKVTLYGASIVIYAFYNHEPDISTPGQTDPLTVVTSTTQPTTVETGATWIVYDMATYPSGSVYVKYFKANGGISGRLGSLEESVSDLEGSVSDLEDQSSNIDKKTKYLFSPKWRDDRRLYYDASDKTLKILGIKTTLSSDIVLAVFNYDGTEYTIKDTVTSKQLTFRNSGNHGLFIPVTSTPGQATLYTLDDIVNFDDALEHDGYIKIAHMYFQKEVCGDLVLNISPANFDILSSSNVETLLKDGIYRTTLVNGSPAILLVSHNGTFQVRYFEYNDVVHVDYRKYLNGAWGNYKPYNHVIGESDLNNLLSNGVYTFSNSSGISQLLLVNANGTVQTRMYRYSGGVIHLESRVYDSENEVWGDWSDYLQTKFTEVNANITEVATNPILKNHTNEEIWWRGSARLFWDANTSKLYWSDGNDTSALHLIVKGKVIELTTTVKEKIFAQQGNYQLLLPIPQENIGSYTLDDIVVQAGTTYDRNSYIKLAHTTMAKGISSFCIDGTQLEPRITTAEGNISNLQSEITDLACLDPEHIYDDAVIPNKNIDSDGTVQNFSGRNILFFKIPPRALTSQAVIVSGCTILVYAWYSGKPDYEGTNFIIRNTSNVPPANAIYGAVTITNYENIKIKVADAPQDDTETNKKIIGLYGSAINNSVGENCFANGLRTNLKILCYGNSFMRNTAHYLSYIAKNGCNVNLTVGNLYTGGTELHNHYSALVNNSADYEWHKYVDGVNTVNQTRQTPMRGLLDEHWDAIIIHQYIPWQYPFEPTLNRFLKLIIERLGYTPKFYINSTWAGTLDNYESYYGFETEEEMWEAMLNACEGACDDSGIQKYSIIPTGTAIQNARTLSFADDWNRFTDGNGDFHHLNPVGGFIVACTVYQKIIAPLNGIPCSNTTFRIPAETYLPPASSGQEPGTVTDSNYMLFCQAAIKAVENPGVITTIPE